MPTDPRRLPITLAVVAMGATMTFALYYWSLGPDAAMPPWGGRLASLGGSDSVLPITVAVYVTGAILVRRQRWWFDAAAAVTAVLAWAWLVDSGAGEANEFLGVILAFFLLPPLIVLEVIVLVRSVHALAAAANGPVRCRAAIMAALSVEIRPSTSRVTQPARLCVAAEVGA